MDESIERTFMREAVEQARLSKNEDETGRYPKVGAVVVKNGEIISKGFRGENPKSHAEYVALEVNGNKAMVMSERIFTAVASSTAHRTSTRRIRSRAVTAPPTSPP